MGGGGGGGVKLGQATLHNLPSPQCEWYHIMLRERHKYIIGLPLVVL